MSQPVIEVEGLSKVYRISHERKGMKGTATLRDALAEIVHKPKRLITGRQLKKEEFWALKDINFEVQPGDVVGIIGKNGSGKSTLLKILSQIVEPTTGEIRMRGRVASLLEVGTGFHPELTGRENIFFNGAILGMKRKEIIRKFDEIVAFSEVEQFLDTPVKFYSSGMYVRLAFAVAAHLDPDILIIDEVLAVGDAEFQRKSLGKMSSVASSGRTVLFVSHSMPTVQKLCTRGIHLADGQIVFDGSIQNAVDSYTNMHHKAQARFDFKTPPEATALAGYITRATIYNKEDEPTSNIAFGEDWQLEVEFKLNETLDDFIIAAGLKSALEVGVRTAWSQSQKLTAGQYRARFNFNDLILEAGSYTLELGISNKLRPIHSIDSQVFLTIEAVARQDPRIILQSGAGLILNPVDVRIEKQRI